MNADERLSAQNENYPALLIGQLAVCDGHHGNESGTHLCDFCFFVAEELANKVGCRFIIVNAIESAIGFYEKYGFKLLPRQRSRKQKTMYLNLFSNVT